MQADSEADIRVRAEQWKRTFADPEGPVVAAWAVTKAAKLFATGGAGNGWFPSRAEFIGEAKRLMQPLYVQVYDLNRLLRARVDAPVRRDHGRRAQLVAELLRPKEIKNVVGE